MNKFPPKQEFSEPTIILFERENFKGKKIELNAETVNLRSMGFNTQIRSVQVIGGMWVTYPLVELLKQATWLFLLLQMRSSYEAH